MVAKPGGWTYIYIVGKGRETHEGEKGKNAGADE